MAHLSYRPRVRHFRFLLRPEWAIPIVVVAAFAYLCFSVLAPWQLGKNARTSHRNHLIAASVRADPVPVTRLLGSGLAGAPASDEWRRVVLTGRYVADSTVLVRLRSDDDKPAFEVLTAFRIEDGRTLLVDRGYVYPVGSTANAAPPPTTTAAPGSTVSMRARLRGNEGVLPSKDPIISDGYRQVYSVDSGQIAHLIGIPLVTGFLQAEAGQPGAFRPIPVPQLAAGPYLSYGLQWLAFGIMAPLGLAYFVRAELRARRRGEQTTATTWPSSAATHTPTQTKLVDRYGKLPGISPTDIGTGRTVHGRSRFGVHMRHERKR